MNIGMLWFDNDPRAGLDVKVERAAAYYRNKYGRAPTLCFVNPSMLPADPDQAEAGKSLRLLSAAGVEVRSNRSVLPNHLWIGVNALGEAAPAGS
jgi:hypothetical protein